MRPTRDYFNEMIEMRAKNSYANCKTAYFVEYHGFMLMDFHETSITGILLMGLSKISCIWKTFCSILCFPAFNLHTHIQTYIHTYIHTYMYANVSDKYICQMQSSPLDRCTPHPWAEISCGQVSY